ncbi:MAG: IclR family transcriptional regulator [bacterium]
MSVQSVKKAFSILSMFSAAQTHFGITEIGKSLGLTNPTVHGLVKTLVEIGYLEQDSSTKKYKLSANIYELGHHYLGSSRVFQTGARATHRLSQKTKLNARLAVRNGDSIIVILDIYPNAEKFQFHQVGPRLPSYCTSLGKAILSLLSPEELAEYLKQTPLIAYTQRTITDGKQLLADLKKGQSQGFVIDQEESTPGAVCVGAPILDSNSIPIAAVSISSGPELLKLQNFPELVDELMQTATEISFALGYNRTLTPIGG